MIRLLKREIRLLVDLLGEKRCSSAAERNEVKALIAKLETVLSDGVRTVDSAPWREPYLRDCKLPSGTRVAIHPTQGIVAQGRSINQVIAQVRRQGLSSAVVYDVIMN